MKPFKTFIAAIAALGISYTWAETVKEFHVFLPNTTTWKSSVPMISEDGKSRELTIDPEHCGWYYRRYVDEAIPKKVFIYRDDDASMNEAIGMNGEWELNDKAEPIVLSDIFELYETDSQFKNAVYFVADAKEVEKLPSTNMGWYTVQPNITGNCRFNLATIIYDTDASLHPSFSCHAAGAKEGNDGCQTRTESQKAIYSCIGVHQGLVESTLSTENGKKQMKLTKAGETCFLNQATRCSTRRRT